MRMAKIPIFLKARISLSFNWVKYDTEIYVCMKNKQTKK